MKKFLFLLTLTASLVTLSPLAGAKDRDKDRDHDSDKHEHDSDRDKKAWKEMRDDVRELRAQSERLADSVNQGGVSRRSRDDSAIIGADVQRISATFDRGNFNYGDLHDRIARVMNAISRTRDQVRYESASRPRSKNYPR